jgi:hypothetical protein
MHDILPPGLAAAAIDSIQPEAEAPITAALES